MTVIASWIDDEAVVGVDVSEEVKACSLASCNDAHRALSTAW